MLGLRSRSYRERSKASLQAKPCRRVHIVFNPDLPSLVCYKLTDLHRHANLEWRSLAWSSARRCSVSSILRYFIVARRCNVFLLLLVPLQLSLSTHTSNPQLKMVWAWQLWLSLRPLHRTKLASQSTFATAGNAAHYEFLTEDDGRWGVRETHYIDNPVVRAGLSGPPL